MEVQQHLVWVCEWGGVGREGREKGEGGTKIGMGNISILSYIVILRAHDNHIVVVLQLSPHRLHIISGAFA